MEAYAKALRDLVSAVSWFVRAKEVRLLDVAVASDMRSAALQVIAGAEYLADNRSPFAPLEDGFEPRRDGWRERAERLRVQHEERRRGMEKEGHALPALPPRPEAASDLAAFGAQVRQVLDAASTAGLEGLVVVLAPARLDGREAWGEAVAQLVGTSGLAGVRWIVVDVGEPALAALASSLGDRAMVHRCEVDEAAARRDLAEMLDAARAAPPGAPSHALLGAAWPRGVTPPPRRKRRDAAGPPVDAEKIVGPAIALAGPAGPELRARILGAALAVREGRGPEAVRLQREARDLCLDAGLTREGTILEVVLGSYLVRFEDPALAREAYEAAAARAEAAGHRDLAAQAHLGLGALHLVGRAPDRALEAYSRAAEHATAAGGLALVAIEAFRLAGQVASDMGRPEIAAQAWRASVDAAARAAPVEAQASGAAEAARALAQHLRHRGQAAAADALLDQARRFELGAAAEVPLPST
jgi:tetratricopeptide (TPR) repeat protein